MFVHEHNESFTTVLVHVDYVILIGNDIHEIARIKQFLDNSFKIRYLGILTYFLGLEIARSKKGISICQRKYALEILKDTGYLACKPASTPMDSHLKLSLASGNPLKDHTVYRVGGKVALSHHHKI